MLYLEPQPADPLVEFTHRIVQRWPEAPPYGGEFDRVIPHLTIAHASEEELERIESELAPSLPLRATAPELCLFAFDGARWQRRASFELANPGGHR